MHPITSWVQDPNDLNYARNAQTGEFRLVDDIANDPEEQWMSIPGYPYYEQSNKTGEWKFVGIKRSNYALIAKHPKYHKAGSFDKSLQRSYFLLSISKMMK